MKKNEFYQGQRVKQKDPDEGYWVYGHVKEIREHSIIIKWNDIETACEHFEDEFDSIKNGLPSNN